MRKRLIIGLATGALLATMLPATAVGDSPNDGCPHGWILGSAVSLDAQAIDARGNGDGLVCGKYLKNDHGQGNGDFVPANAVVKDNNNPAT